ncbi:unnamed protein product [Brassicogethes aeneus]|uniref:Uncharacterized protein n=1 Tax=Brassicogethes aeneus TaxID=1431903 RepID=A0A9P0AXM9_BRAAE|nr:unnamed protein product [Brassicogethes aeneus]
MPKVPKSLLGSRFRTDRCCNSLFPHPNRKNKGLRKVQEKHLLALNIPVTKNTLKLKICNKCRLSLSKKNEEVKESFSDELTDNEVQSIEPTLESPAPEEDDKEIISDAIDAFNMGLQLIGTSPIQKKKVSQKRYSKRKMETISNVIVEKIFDPSVVTNNVEQKKNDGDHVLKVLKGEFNSTEDRIKKIKILTILKDWSFRKIQHHFPSATTHMVIVAKKTCEEKGILSDPNPKSHPSLEEDVVNLIVSFYELDEYSRIMPGKKDYVSVKVNGERTQVQKRLLLINLRELFQLYTEKYPQKKCSFSKFAALRPKHCVLIGASGTHSVCVCAIHENVKLLIEGSNIKNLTANSPNPMRTYHDFLKRMVCVVQSDNCFFGTCSGCPGATPLIQELENLFEENFIEEITYRQWTNVDRTTLQLMISPSDDYLEKLQTSLQKLLLHSFLVKKQNEFINIKKEELNKNECIVVCDFSENYAFVIQDSVQGVHWNNNQATVHPFAIYFRNDDGQISIKSFVVISECLHHDTIAVYAFQKKLIDFIKKNLNHITKITYFSDGASAQYKNKKNFANLTHHVKDFGLAAEWHFFPTSHGKGACDGLGGTLKRLAARTSLQRVSNPIQTPEELFEWASESLPNISVTFVKNHEYDEAKKKLEIRFTKAVTVKGTLSYHCIIPITEKKAIVKHFSLEKQSIKVKIIK